MGPDETSKVFSHVEEKQQLDPLTASINDSIKKTDSEVQTQRGSHHFSAMVEPTLQESEDSAMELIKDVIVPRHDIEPNIAHIYNALEEQVV